MFFHRRAFQMWRTVLTELTSNLVSIVKDETQTNSRRFSSSGNDNYRTSLVELSFFRKLTGNTDALSSSLFFVSTRETNNSSTNLYVRREKNKINSIFYPDFLSLFKDLRNSFIRRNVFSFLLLFSNQIHHRFAVLCLKKKLSNGMFMRKSD